MKIDINKIKLVSEQHKKHELEVCVFNTKLTDEIKEWIDYHEFKTYENNNYINIIIDKNLEELFLDKKFKFMDGFSPNLNKKLHIGHFSNLVLAKALQSLGLCEETVSIYGDTLPSLDQNYTQTDAINDLNNYLEFFNFKINQEFYASKMVYNGKLLDGEDKYENTKVFEIEEDRIVGIKSDGNTSYFYQDVALADILNDSTLYLTGKEQNNHFEYLKKLHPNTEHIGLGLVKISDNKMSSRLGNVIFIEDFINQIKDSFHNDMKLVYNVFAGFVLKSNPDIDKSINLDLISNPKNSSGLYISYTMSRLLSAGCNVIENINFNNKDIEFWYLKSKYNMTPNLLFDSIVELCKEINILYNTHHINNNDENRMMFEYKLSDLILGSKKLGLFLIDKV